MTIFISENLPQQPAFLFASYGPTASASASSSASGYLAADVLQADENNGWKPATTAQAQITIDLGSIVLNDHVALAGNNFAGVSIFVSGSSDGVNFSNTLIPTTLISAKGEAWFKYAPASFRYLRIAMVGHSSAFQIKHVLFGLLVPLPFLEDGACLNPIQSEGQHLISYAGLYLGSVTQRVTRPFSLSFGQVTAVEEAAFSAWMAACVQTAQAFFFVPDLAEPLCYFGYVDKKWKYEATMKTGMATIPKIPFTARVL